MAYSIPENTLVVIADGRLAILFRTQGLGEAMTLREERRLTPQDLDDEAASGPSPVEQTEREEEEATFAKQLARALYQMKHARDYDRAILYADPQTLGQVRKSMHKEVERSLIESVAKDLTKHDVKDIAQAIRRA